MKKFFITALILMGTTGSFAQKSGDFYKFGNHVGLGVGVGTEGIGVDAAVCLNKYFQARVGVNFMPNICYSDDFEIQEKVSTTINGNKYGGTHYGTLSAEASLKRTTMDVKVDFYPFPNKSSFFITGGFSFGGKEILTVNGEVDDATKDLINSGKDFGIDLDGYELPIDENGFARATAEVSGFRPYLGLGFGRLIPKYRVGFRFEIGAQFQGKPKLLDTNGNDLIEMTSDLGESSSTISDVLDYMQVYPCIKLTLRGRIF